MSKPHRRSAGVSHHVRRMWEKTYEQTPYRDLPWFSPRPYYWVERAVRERWIRPGSRVLDVGCGAGTNSIFLARAGFRVAGVDLAPKAVAVARGRAARAGLQIDFRVADALRLPFPATSFGGAVDVGCFHTFDPPVRPAFAWELGRVLRPGARYALSWIGREHAASFGPPHRPGLDEVTHALEERFLFLRCEFHPGGRRAGPPHYTALLERRKRPRPPSR
jgi:SAM-dependent methyltransferase